MIRSALVASIFALPVAAQEVGDCDHRVSAENLPEPWESAAVTRTFANGAVRLAVLDTVEPAAAAFHLMVLSPPLDELGLRQCRIVSRGGLGFAGLTLEGMTSDYDPARGLIFVLQVSLYDPATGGFAPARLQLVLNQATGAIQVDIQ